MKALEKTFRDDVHQRVHGGKYFHSLFQVSRTTTESAAELRFTTTGVASGDYVHMQAEIMATKEVEVKFIENITSTGGAGTAMSEINRERNSANTAGLVVTHTPTASTTGSPTLLSHVLLPLKKRYMIGHEFGGHSEFVLKSGTEYLLRVTPKGSTADIHVDVGWYEAPVL